MQTHNPWSSQARMLICMCYIVVWLCCAITGYTVLCCAIYPVTVLMVQSDWHRPRRISGYSGSSTLICTQAALFYAPLSMPYGSLQFAPYSNVIVLMAPLCAFQSNCVEKQAMTHHHSQCQHDVFMDINKPTSTVPCMSVYVPVCVDGCHFVYTTEEPATVKRYARRAQLGEVFWKSLFAQNCSSPSMILLPAYDAGFASPGCHLLVHCWQN